LSYHARLSPLEALLVSPNDVELLRVYGDWLLAGGNVQGEAIQIACELELLRIGDARRRKLERRFDELTELHERDWLATIAVRVPHTKTRQMADQVRLELVRGVPGHLSGNVPDLVEAFPIAAKLTPINSLAPRNIVVGQLAQLAAMPGFRALARLDLTSISSSDDTELEAVFGSPNFPSLDRLVLGPLMSRRGFRAAASCTQLESVTQLFVMAPTFGGVLPFEDLAPLVERCGPRLRVLKLQNVEVGPAGVAAIAARCTKLRSLGLEAAWIDAGAAQQLATHRAFEGLEELELGSNPLKAKGVAAIAGSNTLAKLARLSFARAVGSPPFGAKVLAAFLDAFAFADLRALDLASCNVRVEGAKLLASAKLDKLVELGLSGNALGDTGIAALAKAKLLAALRVVDLENNAITAAGMRSLAAAPWLATVEELSIARNKCGTGGGEALGASKHLGRLRVLVLGHNWMAGKGLSAILKRASSLEHLVEGMNNYGNAALETFLDSKTLGLTRLRLTSPSSKQLARLAASPRAASLRAVEIFGGTFDDASAGLFATSPYLANLGRLDIGSAASVGNEAHDALGTRFGHRLTIGGMAYLPRAS
jgi:Leucine Rich repeat